MTTINFDMDGTIANLYGVNNWLDYLIAENPFPYSNAKPLLHLASLARILNRLQRKGYNIAIVSWLSKNSTDSYAQTVMQAKINWLKKHLPSVHWDRVSILPYGTCKNNYCFCANDILFDDEKRNRDAWEGQAFDEKNILEILKNL